MALMLALWTAERQYFSALNTKIHQDANNSHPANKLHPVIAYLAVPNHKLDFPYDIDS
jgi:hypothetical protein